MTLKPEHIVEELNRTPKLKRDLIMKMMEVMLDSEAFLEAYPTLYDPRIADVDLEYRKKVCEEMAQIIVRLFRKNKVRPDDAEKVLDRAPGRLPGNVCPLRQVVRKLFQIGSSSAAGGTAVHVVGFNLRSWAGFPDNAVVQKSVLTIIRADDVQRADG